MLKEYPDRVCVGFTLDFEAQIGYARWLSETIEAVQARLPTKLWACSTERYFLRQPENRLFVSFEYARFGFMGLGLDAWMSGLDDYVSLFRMALERMGVEKLKRMSFRTQSFLPVGMTHSETCELMFGSFLVEAKELETICGKPNDLLVQLHGTYKGLITRTVIAPVNTEQAVESFINNPNLELMLEPKLYDTGLKDFRDRIATDCLIVEGDLSQTDTTTDAIQVFARDSLNAADKIAAAVVHRLKRKLTKTGGKYGNPS